MEDGKHRVISWEQLSILPPESITVTITVTMSGARGVASVGLEMRDSADDTLMAMEAHMMTLEHLAAGAAPRLARRWVDEARGRLAPF